MRAVNLIPAEQRSGQPVGAGRSQGAAYAVLALVAGLALMAYLYGGADHKISSSRGQVASLTDQAQRAQAAAEKLAPYTSFIAQREARTQAVETLIDSRFDWAHVFHEFGRVLPSGVSVTSLDGSIGAATASGASSAASSASSKTAGAGSGGSTTPSGSVPTFTLIGCATSQPKVALALQRLRLIDGVKEVGLQSSTATGGSGSSGAGAGGGCPSGDPTFTAQITFDPLPSPTAVAAAAKAVSDTAGAGSTAGAPAPAAGAQR
ncbi:MAG TPA: hypothetical protein VMF09_10970 [Solirubrobacteraceae bacterium]|nr:hypothetical protein [Solirubrobacteraceae bacterium]